MSSSIRSKVVISGSKDRLLDIAKRLENKSGDVLDFERVIAIPDEYKAMGQRFITLGDTAVGGYISGKAREALQLENPIDHSTALKEITSVLKVSMNEILDDATANRLICAYIQYRKPQLGRMTLEQWMDLCSESFRAYQKYGFSCQDDWMFYHWGCKSNAHGVWRNEVFPIKDAPSEITYYFQTSLGAPLPVMKKLHCALFPDVSIVLEYASEFWGEYAGRVIYSPNGTVTEHTFPNHSKEACEVALKVWKEEDLADCIKQDADGSWFVDVNE